jgi:flagellar protein FlaF
MSQSPYKQSYPTVPQGNNPRKTEAWGLMEASKRMKAAQSAPADEEAILTAARLNWKLWTIFQASMTHPDCQWPTDMRANILSLCNFIDKHISDIIAKPKPEKLDVLIRINREIAAGLFADPPATAEIATPAPAGPVDRSA